MKRSVKGKTSANIIEHKYAVHPKVKTKLEARSIEIMLTSGKVKPIELYEEANLGTQVLSNIRRSHFEEPTPIQRYALPCIRQQNDLMACAQTGSGKTVSEDFDIFDD